MQPQPGTLVVEDLHMTYRMLEGPVRAVSFTVAPGEFYTVRSGRGNAGWHVCRKGRIIAAIFAGDQMTYRVAIGAQVLQARSDPLSSFHNGAQVWV